MGNFTLLSHPMDPRAALLSKIEAFLPVRGVSESTFGRMAGQDGKFVERLRTGRNVTIDTILKTEQFISTEEQRIRDEAKATLERLSPDRSAA